MRQAHDMRNLSSPERALSPSKEARVRANWQAIVTLIAGCALGACTVEINQVVADAKSADTGTAGDAPETATGGVNPCDPSPCEAAGVCGDHDMTCTANGNKAACAPIPNEEERAAAPRTEQDAGTPEDAGAAAPDPASLVPGWEAVEATCDALDNDCDGLVDEGLAAPESEIAKCTLGVCAGLETPPACAFGKWICAQPADLPDFQVTETLCDGKDNDCDGVTDEDVVVPPGACKTAGVCAGVIATCASGKWQCDYSNAVGYEATEVSCDGIDNDCDGKVDTGLDLSKLAAMKCNMKGACAATSLECIGGQPLCLPPSDHEEFETLCDGADNDCDGATDNIPGSTLPLRSDSAEAAAPCKAEKGVCSGATFGSCVAGKWICDTSTASLLSTVELCDGLDNDCDGSTDEDVPAPKDAAGTEINVCAHSANSATPLGVCADSAVKPACTGSIFICTGLDKVPFELVETLCDGKDNDCDGDTDETVTTAGAGCKAQGVCAYGVAALCKDATATCAYDNVLAYEATETSCDGKDNDCNGLTDDNLDPKGSACSFQGVCADTMIATCKDATWSCDTSQVAGYEETEKSCDGKDNDCNGQTDENLNDLVAAECKTAGVCGLGAVSKCDQGQWQCSFTSPAWQIPETACDGLDNDCDGITDLGVCKKSEPCASDKECTSGACVASLGGGMYCGTTATDCAYIKANGAVEILSDGKSVCATSGSTVTCTAGSWAAPSACGPSSPTCVAGECFVCAPKSTYCNGSDVMTCDDTGSAGASSSTCGAGTHCSGAGQCVADAEIVANDQPTGNNALVADLAVLGNGGFALAWVSQSGTPSIQVRAFGADAAPLGNAGGANTSAINAAIPPTVARIDGGFVVAWTASSADGSGDGIVLRTFDDQGNPVSGEIVANAIVAGNQQRPSAAYYPGGFVLAWEGLGIDSDNTGIALRHFNTEGIPVEKTDVGVNVDPANPDAQKLAQSNAVVAARSDGTAFVVWTSVTTSKKRTMLRGVTSGGLPQTAILAVSTDTANDQVSPDIAVTPGGIVIVTWQAKNFDGAADGIAMRRYSASGVALGNPGVVNSVTSNAQGRPSVDVLPDGSVIFAFESVSFLDPATLQEIVWRQMSANGDMIGDDVIVNTTTDGSQTQARVVVFADGRVLFGWVSAIQGGKPGDAMVKFK